MRVHQLVYIHLEFPLTLVQQITSLEVLPLDLLLVDHSHKTLHMYAGTNRLLWCGESRHQANSQSVNPIALFNWTLRDLMFRWL
jgi:hypothetical protein